MEKEIYELWGHKIIFEKNKKKYVFEYIDKFIKEYSHYDKNQIIYSLQQMGEIICKTKKNDWIVIPLQVY